MDAEWHKLDGSRREQKGQALGTSGCVRIRPGGISRAPSCARQLHPRGNFATGETLQDQAPGCKIRLQTCSKTSPCIDTHKPNFAGTLMLIRHEKRHTSSFACPQTPSPACPAQQPLTHLCPCHAEAIYSGSFCQERKRFAFICQRSCPPIFCGQALCLCEDLPAWQRFTLIPN